MKRQQVLKKTLSLIIPKKFAQQDEASNVLLDWEEAAKEFGEDPISEDEYLDAIAIEPKIEIDSVGFDNEKIKNKIQYIYKYLRIKGIRLISTNEDIIGSGSFGNVYRCIYKGNPAVIKIYADDGNSYNSYLSQDVKNIKLLNNILASGVPEFVRKIIPKIFLAEKLEIQDTPIFIIVTEELEKITKGIDMKMNGIPIKESDVDNLIKFVNYDIRKVIQEKKVGFMNGILGGKKILSLDYSFFDMLCINILSLFSSNMNRKILRQEILDKVNSYKKENIQCSSIKPSLLEIFGSCITLGSISDFKDFLRKNCEQKYISDAMQIVHMLISFFYDCIEICLDRCPIVEQFPIEPEYDKGNYQPPEELKDLYEGVKWLRENNFPISDVHSENVMMDKNHNIKIIDFGFVDFKKNQT